MMVSVSLSIPSSLAHNLSKTALRRADVEIWGASWDSADVLCREHGLINNGIASFHQFQQQKVDDAMDDIDELIVDLSAQEGQEYFAVQRLEAIKEKLETKYRRAA